MTMTTFTAREWILIAIANAFGHDKKDWSFRLTWAYEHEDHFEEMIHEADDPHDYWCAVKALRDTDAGLPTGYMISVDATASGPQILACLTGDPQSARMSNVHNAGYRVDLYTEGAELIKKNLLASGANAEFVDSLSRVQIKNGAIVPALYSSVAGPKEVFGEENYPIFCESMKQLLPGVWSLQEFLLKAWRKDVSEYIWVLPDNFHVHDRVHSMVHTPVSVFGHSSVYTHKVYGPKDSGRSLGANLAHSLDGFFVREMNRRCNYDPKRIAQIRNIIINKELLKDLTPVDNENTQMLKIIWNHYQESKFLSARILDYITEDNVSLIDTGVITELLDTMPKKPFKMICIHDCFKIHPNYCNDVRNQYTLLLANLWKSNMLEFILKRMLSRNIKIKKINPEGWKDVYNADYALC